jgi:hypothetical protein
MPEASGYEPSPLAVLIIALLTLGVLIGYCIAERKSAPEFGLALIAGSAVIATPKLVANEASHRLPASLSLSGLHAAAGNITAVASVATLAAISCGVIAAAAGWHQVGHALAVLIGLLIAAVVVAFAIWMTLGIADTPGSASSAGRLRSFADNIDRRGWLWILAGLLFFIGTLLQLFFSK